MFVHSVAVTADSRRAVSGGLDGTVRVWDLETAAELRAIKGHQIFVFGVAVSPDSRRVVLWRLGQHP